MGAAALCLCAVTVSGTGREGHVNGQPDAGLQRLAALLQEGLRLRQLDIANANGNAEGPAGEAGETAPTPPSTPRGGHPPAAFDVTPPRRVRPSVGDLDDAQLETRIELRQNECYRRRQVRERNRATGATPAPRRLTFN